MLYKAFAPGSLMMFGEYAVLHNKTAIVIAIDKYITVTLSPRNDNHIIIHSELGHFTTTIHDLTITPPFEFVLCALSLYKNTFPCGFNLNIEAEFSPQLGLGSSAAVTVATLTVIHLWKKKFISKKDLLDQAKNVIRQVQNGGSGADAAASIFGGIVVYKQASCETKNLHHFPNIIAVYTGKKTTTKNALATMHQKEKQNPNYFNTIYNNIEQLSLHAIQAIQTQNWHYLGNLLTKGHHLMQMLGVSHASINNMIHVLKQQPRMLGAKISGSGMGDCIIAIGELTQNVALNIIPLAITAKGVTHHAD